MNAQTRYSETQTGLASRSRTTTRRRILTSSMSAGIVTILVLLLSIVPPAQSGWLDPDTPPPSRTIKALTPGDNRVFEMTHSPFQTLGSHSR